MMTETPRIHRFDFNSLRDFRGPIVMHSTSSAAAVEEENAPPAPVYNEADLDAARLAVKAQAYAEGFAAGLQEAKQQADAKTDEVNALIAHLGQQIDSLHPHYRALLETEATYTSQLALALARKVAAEALTARAEEVIAAVVAQAMHVIFSKPRLVIELHPDMFERTLERVETQLRTGGFEGEIQFKANSALDASDVRLDWVSGSVARSTAGIWQELEAIIGNSPSTLAFPPSITPSLGE